MKLRRELQESCQNPGEQEYPGSSVIAQHTVKLMSSDRTQLFSPGNGHTRGFRGTHRNGDSLYPVLDRSAKRSLSQHFNHRARDKAHFHQPTTDSCRAANRSDNCRGTGSHISQSQHAHKTTVAVSEERKTGHRLQSTMRLNLNMTERVSQRKWSLLQIPGEFLSEFQGFLIVRRCCRGCFLLRQPRRCRGSMTRAAIVIPLAAGVNLLSVPAGIAGIVRRTVQNSGASG